MSTNGKFSQAQLASISNALARFEERELAKRKLEAEQLADLSEALSTVVDSGIPPGDEREMQYRSLRFEVAALLHESEFVAERLLDTALSAVNLLPRSHAALARGEISLAHVRVISDAAAPIGSGDTPRERSRRASYDSAVTQIAAEESPNRLKPTARALAAAESQESLTEQHERAVGCRSVRVVDGCDGMADLIAHLPAIEAHAIFDRLTRVAKALPDEDDGAGDGAGGGSGGGEKGAGATSTLPHRRPLDAVRADTLRDLLIGDDLEDLALGLDPAQLRMLRGGGAIASTREAARGVRGQVQVIVPGELVGLHGGEPEAAPAQVTVLGGYGPIDPETAKRFAGETEAWDVVTVNTGGGVLAVDRYRPTPEMRRRLAARDLHCRAPGCRVPAHRCDIDHTQDAALGGETSTANLAHLCRGHHTLKHHSDWTLKQGENGEMVWTSPTGRTHIDKPASRVRFRKA